MKCWKLLSTSVRPKPKLRPKLRWRLPKHRIGEKTSFLANFGQFSRSYYIFPPTFFQPFYTILNLVYWCHGALIYMHKSRPILAWQIFGEKNPHFCVILTHFLGRDSAEASAEASVKVAEASVSAESRFRPIRSFTTSRKYHVILHLT